MNNLFQPMPITTTDVTKSTQLEKLISTYMDSYSTAVFQKDTATALSKGNTQINTNTITITPSKHSSHSIVNGNMNMITTSKNIIQDSNSITKVKEIVPEKVYLFTFADGSIIKTICDKNDIFDFEFAFYLALAKKLYSYIYTMDGIMNKARELKYEKYFVKIVNKGIKKFYKDQKENAKREEEEKLKKERHKKFIEKKIAKKRKKRNKK